MRYLSSLILFLGFWMCLTQNALAISDPRETVNNKIGIHVLDPGEINEAAELVNNNQKAAFGYLTVPIQSIDRNRKRWGEFMRLCKEKMIIPIIRVATVPEGSNWARPNNYDLIDFANFLNELEWPTENRYVIIFNEVNHGNEFGGLVSPEQYADILVNAIKIFKERNENFFILPAAMDNATKSNGASIYWKEYLLRMYRQQPQVFSLIDGWNSHAYPNPGFVGQVFDKGERSINSFKVDLNLVQSLGASDIPVFITETGWDMSVLGEEKTAANFKQAWETVWNDARIVAITPFLLRAGEGPFTKFSWLRKDGGQTLVYQTWKELAQVQGKPKIAGIEIKPESGLENKKEIESNSDWFMIDLSVWKHLWQAFINWLEK